MQDSLTFLYDLILGVGGSYLGLSFLIGVVDLWKRSSPDYAGRATEDITSENAVNEKAAAENAVAENAVEETPVPLELPETSVAEAIALPELVPLEQEDERELEPVEVSIDFMEDMETPAPPKQLEM